MVKLKNLREAVDFSWSLRGQLQDIVETPAQLLPCLRRPVVNCVESHGPNTCRVNVESVTRAKFDDPYIASPIPQPFQSHQSAHSSTPCSPKQLDHSFTFFWCDNKHSGSRAVYLDLGVCTSLHHAGHGIVTSCTAWPKRQVRSSLPNSTFTLSNLNAYITAPSSSETNLNFVSISAEVLHGHHFHGEDFNTTLSPPGALKRSRLP